MITWLEQTTPLITNKQVYVSLLPLKPLDIRYLNECIIFELKIKKKM